MKHDLTVAYRICPHGSKHHPPIHADNKRALAEMCLDSFKKSCGNLHVRMIVVLDGCDESWRRMFAARWDLAEIRFVQRPGIGDGGTFRLCVEELLKAGTALVYLAEDDYLYKPVAMEQMVRFMRANPDASFASLYDHPDHEKELHKQEHTMSTVKDWPGMAWYSRYSTTHTFMAQKLALIECRDVFLKEYGKISPDLAKWLALTKTHVFNPIRFSKWCLTNRFWAASVALAWWYCWRQILQGRKQSLWIARPPGATHMVKDAMAKGFEI